MPFPPFFLLFKCLPENTAKVEHRVPVRKSLRLWASLLTIGQIAPMRMIDVTETETSPLMIAAQGLPQSTRWAVYAGLGETRRCLSLPPTKNTVIDKDLPRLVGGARPVQRKSPVIIITAVEDTIDTELSAPGQGQCRHRQHQTQQQHGALLVACRRPIHRHALLRRRAGTKAMGGPPAIGSGINKGLQSLRVLRDIASMAMTGHSSILLRGLLHLPSPCRCHQPCLL